MQACENVFLFQTCSRTLTLANSAYENAFLMQLITKRVIGNAARRFMVGCAVLVGASYELLGHMHIYPKP